MRVYRELFAVGGVRRLAVAAALSRLTTSMLSLSLAIAVSQLRSVADAGLVLTALSVSIAVFAPISGRLVDRIGPRPTLFGCLAGHAVAYAVLLAALQQQVATSLIGLAAVAVGATMPPSSAVIRGHWPVIVPPDRIRTAYAFDSALNSTTFVAGPLVSGLLIAAVSPYLAIVAGAVTKLIGDLLLTTTPTLGGRRNAPSAMTGWLRRMVGPVGDGQVRLVLVVISLDTFGYGCLDIAAVALGNGNGSAAGLLLGALSAGEVVGGLCYGARLWPGRIRTQLIVLHLGTAALVAATSPWHSLLMIGLFFLAAGIAGGARDTLNQVLLTETSPVAQRTESFAWLGTFMWTGFGIGTAVAGQVQSAFGTHAVFLTAAVAALVAAAAAFAVRATPRQPVPSGT